MLRLRNLTHGMTHTRDYQIWAGIKQRCQNPGFKDYANYGGRGITMCDRWSQSFEAFFADMGPCPPGMWIERTDNDGHYEPSNCRWATQREQANNKRNNRPLTLNGTTYNIAQWEQRLGLPENVISRRLKRGWPVDRALTTPLAR